jgi:hypothetical protein
VLTRGKERGGGKREEKRFCVLVTGSLLCGDKRCQRGTGRCAGAAIVTWVMVVLLSSESPLSRLSHTHGGGREKRAFTKNGGFLTRRDGWSISNWN